MKCLGPAAARGRMKRAAAKEAGQAGNASGVGMSASPRKASKIPGCVRDKGPSSYADGKGVVKDGGR